MKIIYVLNFMDGIEKTISPVKKWFYEHHDNPLMWLGFFILGYIVFQITYSALQKEK